MKVDNVGQIKTMKAITNRNGAACCRTGKFLFSSQAGNQEKEGHSPYELLHEDFQMLSQIQRFGGAMFTPVLLFPFAGIVVGIAIMLRNRDMIRRLESYSYRDQLTDYSPDKDNNVLFYYKQLVTAPARLAGTEDIAIGTPVAGRGEAELDQAIASYQGRERRFGRTSEQVTGGGAGAGGLSRGSLRLAADLFDRPARLHPGPDHGQHCHLQTP